MHPLLQARSSDSTVAWLLEIAASRRWSSPPAARDAREAAAAYLAARLAGELHELAQLVERAEQRLRVAGQALDQTPAGIDRQAEPVEPARHAAGVLGPASATVADHASH